MKIALSSKEDGRVTNGSPEGPAVASLILEAGMLSYSILNCSFISVIPSLMLLVHHSGVDEEIA